MHLYSRIGTLITLGLLSLGISRAADLPPLNDPPNQESHPGKFVWGDLLTDNADSAAKFYTSLLGWTAETVERTTPSGPKPYIVLSNAGRPVAGITHRPRRMGDQAHGRWVGYISVPDVGQALARATAGGGRVISKAKNVPNRGTQAIFADSEGAILGLMHSSTGDPGEYLPEPGDWTWSELFARNPVDAGKFYRDLAGYGFMPDTRTPRPDDYILTSGGYSRASVIPLSDKAKVHAIWLLFVRVANVRETVARVKALGGRVVVAPTDEPTTYWRAVIGDPDGADIGLVQLDAPATATASKEAKP
ncbi:MAG TPA: VOC family protein [Candidatus Didemnitutus sp.]|jgi:hypothetical protein